MAAGEDQPEPVVGDLGQVSLSTSDRMIHPDSERQMAERMKPRTTIELDASHASLASRPAAIVD
jgi:hypothetical protein